MIYAAFNHTRQMKMLILLGNRCVRVPFFGAFLGAFFQYLVRIFFSSDISCMAIIPKSTIFVHGHDIVIGAKVILGENCKIFNGVTLGSKNTEGWKPGDVEADDQPEIGSGCVISTGAKILGKISIGDRSIIGANAVVINDVPPNSVAVGVPARIVGKNDT